MGMKLMPKSEVEKAKSAEQKQAVDEGMKLARRIDNLREIAASEEVSLENFRRTTVERIHEEISTETGKRDALRTEVATLERRRKEAIKPLDEEWEALRVAKEELEREGAALGEREFAIRKMEQHTFDTKSETDGILARAKTKDELSNTRLHEAEKAAKDAESALAHAVVVHDEALAYEAKIKEAVTHRENIVLAREIDATIRGKELLAREIALADGWILLRDREALLERTIKRSK